MLLLPLLFLVVCFLAWTNGANDNFKGVASLYGSRTCSYRTALAWATATTAAGSLTAMVLAQELLKRFSGKGLVPDALTAQPVFLAAVALGAGATVMLATRFGFPISTTHALTGALVGAGLVHAPGGVNFGALGTSFVMPLLVSPVLATAVGVLLYSLLSGARRLSGIRKESCVCVGPEPALQTAPGLAAAAAAEALPQLTVTAGAMPECRERYAGHWFGLSVGRLVDALHFLSAGAVSFARGLNDTPKIAALLLVAAALHIRWGIAAIAVSMAIGGLLNSRRVAHTMAHNITALNGGQGFAANLATALLVNTASFHGLPVSTTHVSVGSLLGVGIVTRQAKWKPIAQVALSWVVTLPCALVLAVAMAWAMRAAAN
jgi:PiT family inorganic phosphate transporter